MFLKRVQLFPDRPALEPGDPVTEEVAQTLGAHRLKIWWHARMIGQRKFVVFEPDPEKVKPGMIHLGAGWYDVTRPDGSTARIRGKKEAEALLEG